MADPLQRLRWSGQQNAGLAAAIRELAGDDDLAFVDTLEAESDAIDCARAAVRLIHAASHLEAAAKALARLYSDRAGILADREGRARDALAQFMAEIGETTLPLPEGTVSLAAGTVQLTGEADVGSLPDDLVRVTRSPDRTAIKAALVAGRQVPGYALTNARPSLRIRTR